MLYFTSDLHIGQDPAVFRIPRPFASRGEMNDTLIRRWNNTVKDGDTVYIVGDLFTMAFKYASVYLDMLNGEKHLILGNHDKLWLRSIEPKKYFKSIDRFAQFSYGDDSFVVCHYPMVSWDGFNCRTYHIYGHVHNYASPDYWPMLASLPYALNAGVDVNDYRPVSLDELIVNNRAFLKEHPPGVLVPKDEAYWDQRLSHKREPPQDYLDDIIKSYK